jgi:polyferredoxin
MQNLSRSMQNLLIARCNHQLTIHRISLTTTLLSLLLIFTAVPWLHISYTKSPSCANSKPIQSYIFLIHSAHTLMLFSQTALAASKIVLKSRQAPSKRF